MNRMAVPLDHDPIESDHDLVSLFEHDPENRFPPIGSWPEGMLFRIML
jgi:hypothetical protein